MVLAGHRGYSPDYIGEKGLENACSVMRLLITPRLLLVWFRGAGDGVGIITSSRIACRTLSLVV